MTDLLERAIVWLEGQRVRHLGRQVLYQRGGDSVTVTGGGWDRATFHGNVEKAKTRLAKGDPPAS